MVYNLIDTREKVIRDRMVVLRSYMGFTEYNLGYTKEIICNKQPSCMKRKQKYSEVEYRSGSFQLWLVPTVSFQLWLTQRRKLIIMKMNQYVSYFNSLSFLVLMKKFCHNMIVNWVTKSLITIAVCILRNNLIIALRCIVLIDLKNNLNSNMILGTGYN